MGKGLDTVPRGTVADRHGNPLVGVAEVDERFLSMMSPRGEGGSAGSAAREFSYASASLASFVGSNMATKSQGFG